MVLAAGVVRMPDDERHPHRAVEEDLLVEEAGVAVHLAVVRGEHDDGAIPLAPVAHGLEDLTDGLVDETRPRRRSRPARRQRRRQTGAAGR